MFFSGKRYHGVKKIFHRSHTVRITQIEERISITESFSGRFWKTSLNVGKRLCFYQLHHKHCAGLWTLSSYPSWFVPLTKAKPKCGTSRTFLSPRLQITRNTRAFEDAGERSLPSLQMQSFSFGVNHLQPIAPFIFHVTSVQSPYAPQNRGYPGTAPWTGTNSERALLAFFPVYKSWNPSAGTSVFGNGSFVDFPLSHQKFSPPCLTEIIRRHSLS